MAIYYFLAMSAARMSTFLALIVFSRLFTPLELGGFVLVSNNALTIEILLGSWVSTSAYRFMASTSDEERRTALSNLAASVLFTVPAIPAVMLTVTKLGLTPLDAGQSWMASILAICLLAFDVTLAAKNGLRLASEYARMSIIRNIGSFGLSLLAILSGFGLTGALLGQIAGIVLSLASRTSVALWSEVRLSQISITKISDYVRYGAVGGLVFGFYMLMHSVSRNIVALATDEASAGAFAVTFDVFFGPLALIGSSFSLTHMAQMNSAGREEGGEKLQSATANFLDQIVFFLAPYLIGGLILSPDLAKLPFGANLRDVAAALAPYAMVHAVCITLFSAMAVSLLAGNHRGLLLRAIIATLGANAAAMLAAGGTKNLQVFAGVSTVVMAVAAIALTVTALRMKLCRVNRRQAVLSAVAALVMAGVTAPFAGRDTPLAAIVGVIVGGCVYLALGDHLQLFPVRALLAGLWTRVRRARARTQDAKVAGGARHVAALDRKSETNV
jgi:O-antigen/teichoic acid export membrane protein